MFKFALKMIIKSINVFGCQSRPTINNIDKSNFLLDFS